MQHMQASIARSPFGSLAKAYAASLAGDACVAVALAGSLFFTVPVDSARPNVALYLLVTMTPFGLVAPVLGPALDRAKARRVAIAAITCVGRAVLCLLMARHLDSFLLYPEAFGVLVLMKGFAVAKASLVPAVTKNRAELVRANSRLTLVGVMGGAVGGAAALIVMQIGGASWVLYLGIGVYAVAARLSSIVPARVAPPSEDDRGPPVRLSGIRLASIAMAVLRGSVGFLVFLLAFELKRSDEPAWFYGLVIVASSLGGLIGAVAAPRLRRMLREEAVLVISIALPATAALLAARSEARPAALLVALAVGVGAASGRAGFDALVQRDAPDSQWGRSFARYEAYFQLAWVLGAFVPTIIVMSAGTGLLLLALGLAAGGFFYLVGLAADSLIHREHG